MITDLGVTGDREPSREPTSGPPTEKGAAGDQRAAGEKRAAGDRRTTSGKDAADKTGAADHGSAAGQAAAGQATAGEATAGGATERGRVAYWLAVFRRARRPLLIGLLAVWAVAITAVVLFRDGAGGSGDDAGRAPGSGAAPTPSASQGPLTVPQLYQALLPSTVLIQTTGPSASTGPRSGGMAQSATGTGFIVNGNGMILTAEHVIDGAKSIKLTYADGSTAGARVASADAALDIATLIPAKLPETVVPAVLGGGVQVGDEVVAIGNPLGLTMTTTDGVVSGLDRRMARSGAEDIAGLIQFDAAVNPGSSGGPLINNRGQVVGVVVALANPTDAGTFIGIGFAVPIGAALGGGDGNGPAAPPL